MPQILPLARAAFAESRLCQAPGSPSLSRAHYRTGGEGGPVYESREAKKRLAPPTYAGLLAVFHPA